MTDRLAEIRIDHDESQRDLAKAIGYHQTQIARYETGKNTPPISYIIAVCNHYGISADYVLGLKKGLAWPR